LHLGKLLGSPALIDTEQGSASKYAGDEFDFDTCKLTNYSPEDYTKAIGEAKGYKTLIIDSLSHAWNGKGGALELVDKLAASAGNNKFGGWKDVTPLQNRMIEAILGYPGHVIITLRTKTEYALESYQDRNGNTKTRPVKLGLAPVQRDGIEYEFDVVCRLEEDHSVTVLKSRCEPLDSKSLPADGAYDLLYQELRTWLGTDFPEPPAKKDPDFGKEIGTEIRKDSLSHVPSKEWPANVAKPDEPNWEELVTIGAEYKWTAGFIRQWVKDCKAKGEKRDDIYARGMAKFSQMNSKYEATEAEAAV
jgi:hypothetical protein